MINRQITVALIFLSGVVLANKNKVLQAMEVYEKQYEAVMSNVVNSKTPGYKAVVTSVGSEQGNLKIKADNSLQMGNRVYSGNPMHFAIEGSGFFVVSTQQGNLLTRDGRFVLRPDLRLGSLSGDYPLVGEDGEIVLNVDENGSAAFGLSKTGIIDQNGLAVGRLLIVNCEKVENINGVFFKPLSPMIPVETPKILQLYYETSNVDITKELIKMPMVTKKYDASSKVLQMLKNADKTGLEMGRSQ